MMDSRQLLRVLLVEDSIEDAELMTREIERSDHFDVYTERVETEAEVREALHDKSWDTVICDFSLPKLDALKVLSIIESLTLDIPFILVSGAITDKQADEMLGHKGVHEYVAKDKLARLGAVFHREINSLAAYDSTLVAWARALELRDRETAGHSERVSSMTVRLAREMDVSETEIIHIRRGALLHDIGKMGISDNVLLKPEGLTPEEMEIMRAHPLHAYNLLLPIQFLRKSLDIPYCHHERWDGTGYPRGLRGQQIPLHARMFAVVDVYDAMTSDRPYRNPFPARFALKYIGEQSGIAFDPVVVTAFVRMMRKNGQQHA
jgi:response regulator RpfG family c-di-GMP phosphodiesterase